jgi:hypothetical protein
MVSPVIVVILCHTKLLSKQLPAVLKARLRRELGSRLASEMLRISPRPPVALIPGCNPVDRNLVSDSGFTLSYKSTAGGKSQHFFRLVS